MHCIYPNCLFWHPDHVYCQALSLSVGETWLRWPCLIWCLLKTFLLMCWCWCWAVTTSWWQPRAWQQLGGSLRQFIHSLFAKTENQLFVTCFSSFFCQKHETFVAPFQMLSMKTMWTKFFSFIPSSLQIVISAQDSIIGDFVTDWVSRQMWPFRQSQRQRQRQRRRQRQRQRQRQSTNRTQHVLYFWKA